MITQELKDFVKKELEAGVSKEEIVKKLLDTGWKQEDIDNCFSELENKPLSILEKFFLSFFIILDLVFVFYYAYHIRNAVDGMSNIGLFVMFIPLFFINLILTVYFFQKKLYWIIILLPFIFLGPFILTPFSPTTSFTRDRSVRIQKEIVINNIRNLEQKAILSTVVEEFKNPHKVLFVGVEATTTQLIWNRYYLVLDNGYVVYLSNNPIELSGIARDNFMQWANKNLINKEAIFSLPNFNIAKDFKISGVDILKCDDMNNKDKDYQDDIKRDMKRTQEIRIKHNIDPNTSNLCTKFPVNIDFNGENLYQKFQAGYK